MAQTISCSLSRHIDRLRPLVDAALDDFSKLPNGCPDDLREAIRYSLLAPGKRLRPLLLLMAAEACGGRACGGEAEATIPAAAVPAAVAVEMVHADSLVHDDLPAMDDDDLRRGRPTCHKKFGEAMAILVGDALLALALQTLAEMPARPEIVARCCGILAEAAGPCQLVGGQADDIAGGLDADSTDTGSTDERLKRLESIHRRKTGALILASLRIGGLIAGADSAGRDALEQYGRRLGLAFQVTDDLLDARGDEAALGKRVGKDAGQGKLTFPGLLGVEKSDALAKQLISEARHALAPLGESAEALSLLAQYVLERKS